MIPALGWLSPAFLASSALGGGRSPAGWQQLTSQAAWRAGDLRRLSSWMGFLETARPHLCPGPLLGHGLDLAMTGSSSPPVKTEPLRRAGRTRPERAEVRAAPVEVRAAPKRAPAPASIATGVQGWTSTECLRLPSQAEREFLNALAKRRPRRRALRTQIGTETASSGRNGFGVSGLPEALSEGHPAAASQIAGRGAPILGDRLIRRVTRTLDRFAPFGAMPQPDLGAAGGESIDPWSALLEGPAADLELLNGLTAFQSGTGVSKPHHPAREATPDADRRPSSQQPETLGTTRAIETAFNPQSGAGQRQIASDAIAAGEAVTDELRFSSPFHPASPFQPAWMAGITRATPEAKAAGSTRRVADSATPPDWNLESLSMAMKRILDEEARRHGIDV